MTLLSRRTLPGKALDYALRQGVGLRERLRDARRCSYLQDAVNWDRLGGFCGAIAPELLARPAVWLAAVCSNYLEHRFDLLGSGWVQVKHGMRCHGVEGHRYQPAEAVNPDSEGRWLTGRMSRSNLTHSQRIWRMVERGYLPIDWHLDFKSGYRWKETTWYLDVRYGNASGADIKVPWELARMQHLPQLALAYAAAKKGLDGFAPPEKYASEFRNQVLDFIAANPPRFGVNWRSAMEAGIRAANWALAADLFRANAAGFDSQFESVLARSLYEHGLHIESNLEWDPQVRGNHYLANVVGLLFIAAYLPCNPKTDAWLAFAVQELINEAAHQFAADGSHREASTSYHRLSAEMTAYATSLVLGLPTTKREALQRYDHRLITTSRPALAPAPIKLYDSEYVGGRTPFPGWYFERLEKMGEFTADITKPDGHAPQIGDNDSGRFLRVGGVYEQITAGCARARYGNLRDYDGLPDNAPYWHEDHLDHRGLLAAIGTLLGRHDFVAAAGEGWMEAEVVRGLAGSAQLASRKQPYRHSAAQSVRVGTESGLERLIYDFQSAGIGASQSFEIMAPGADLREGLACCGYIDFGLYIFRSRRLYLAVRCGRIGLVGNGGHAHHDQLSIELNLDGSDRIVDPGTYLYTALPGRRNEYRSSAAHFAPQVQGSEPDGIGSGLFQMRERAGAQCLYFGVRGFAGCHWGYGAPLYRAIELGADRIRIIDCFKGGSPLRGLTLAAGYRAGWRESPPPSTGYGIVFSGQDSRSP